jgi:hypothetical protein
MKWRINKMNKYKIRIIAIFMAIVLILINTPFDTISLNFNGGGNIGEAFNDVINEKRTDEEAATPSDAVVQGCVAISVDTDNRPDNLIDIAGLEYGIYSDEACNNKVDNFVLSYDGHGYMNDKGENIVIYKDTYDTKDYEQYYCWLPLGTYYYKVNEKLYESEIKAADTGYGYVGNIGSFTITSDNISVENAVDITISVSWGMTCNGTATCGDAAYISSLENNENESDISNAYDISNVYNSSENITATEESQESEGENTLQNTATAGDTMYMENKAETTDMVFDAGPLSVVFEIPLFLAAVTASTTEGYRLGRASADNTVTDYRIYQVYGDGSTSKKFSVYCGDHDADMPWNSNTISSGEKVIGTSATVYSDDNSDEYNHNGGSYLSSNIKKALYYGYKNKVSQDSIQNTLNSIRHSGASYSGDIPLTRSASVIKIGSDLPSPDVTDIAPSGTYEDRYKYTYNMDIDVDSYISTNTPTGDSLKRTDVLTVSGGSGGNSFKISVPGSSTATLWVCTNWEGKVSDSTWKSYKGGKEVTLSVGTKFLFTAPKTSSGTTKISKTYAEKDGFTSYAVVPDNSNIQTCFAGALYEYTLAMTVDWGEASADGKFTIKKSSENEEAVSSPGHTNYYNMAGIRYTIYSDSKCTDKAGADIVLSYDGKAYQDGDGKNIVFISASAKKYYKEKYPDTLKTYYWTKKDIEADKEYTFYFKEQSTIYKSGGKAVWYAEKGDAYGYYADGEYPYTDNSMKNTGYVVDNKVHSFVLGKKKEYVITADVSDGYETGKIKVTKKYNGDTSQLKGIKFYLYKVKSRKTAPTDTENSILVGAYTINSSGAGIPVSLTKEGKALGIKTNYENENIDDSTRRYFFNLPLGWYCIREDADIAAEKGYVAASDYYCEITKDNNEAGHEFNIKNYKGSLSLFKDSDNQAVTGNSSEYNLAGAAYKVYMVSADKSTSTSNYVCEITTDKEGKGYISDMAADKGYYKFDTHGGKSYAIGGLPVDKWYYIAETGNKWNFTSNLHSNAKGYIVNTLDSGAGSYYRKWVKIKGTEADKTSYGTETDEAVKLLTVKETPVLGKISLKKEVNATSNYYKKTAEYPLEGIEYKVYMVEKASTTSIPSDTTKYVGTFSIENSGSGKVTDINNNFIPYAGNGKKVTLSKENNYIISDLPLGHYLIVETKTNSYFKKNTAPISVYISDEKEKAISDKYVQYDLSDSDVPETGTLALNKTVGNNENIKNNKCYSIAGAEYSVYMTADNKSTYNEENQVGKFVIGENETAVPYISNTCGSKNGFKAISGDICTIATDLNKNTFTNLPFGWYAIVETKAPAGYTLDKTVYYKYISPDNKNGKVNQIVESEESWEYYQPEIRLVKKAGEDNIASSLSLENTIFKIDYYEGEANEKNGYIYQDNISNYTPARTWYIKTTYDSDTEEYVALLDKNHILENSDELYYDSDEDKYYIPFGTIVISEAAAPEGYNKLEAGSGWIEIYDMDGNETHKMDNNIFVGYIGETGESGKIGITAASTGCVIDDNNISVYDEVKRGDIVFEKKNFDTNEGMAGVAFKISLVDDDGNEIESHIAVTDEEGKFMSNAILHTENTNENDAIYEYNKTHDKSEWKAYNASYGIWFSGYNSETAEQVDSVLGSRGALPYGHYIIQEIDCLENQNFILMDSQKFTISEDKEVVDLDSYENVPEPELQTKEYDYNSKTHISKAEEETHIVDDVNYKWLQAGKTYTLKAILVDKNGNPLKDINGEYIRANKVFTTDSSYERNINEKTGCESVDFIFNSLDFQVDSFVVFEYLYEGQSDELITVNENGVISLEGVMTNRNGEYIAHADINSEDQTGYIKKDKPKGKKEDLPDEPDTEIVTTEVTTETTTETTTEVTTEATTEVTTETTTEEQDTPDTPVTKTGDNMPLYIVEFMCAASLISAIFLGLKKKKKH